MRQVHRLKLLSSLPVQQGGLVCSYMYSYMHDSYILYTLYCMHVHRFHHHAHNDGTFTCMLPSECTCAGQRKVIAHRRTRPSCVWMPMRQVHRLKLLSSLPVQQGGLVCSYMYSYMHDSYILYTLYCMHVHRFHHHAHNDGTFTCMLPSECTCAGQRKVIAHRRTRPSCVWMPMRQVHRLKLLSSLPVQQGGLVCSYMYSYMHDSYILYTLYCMHVHRFHHHTMMVHSHACCHLNVHVQDKER